MFHVLFCRNGNLYPLLFSVVTGITGMSCRCHSFLHPCIAINGLGLTKLSQVFQSLQSDGGLHSLSCWVQEHGNFKAENVDKFPKFIHIIVTTDWNCIPTFRLMASSHRPFYCHVPRDMIHNMPSCHMGAMPLPGKNLFLMSCITAIRRLVLLTVRHLFWQSWSSTI